MKLYNPKTISAPIGQYSHAAEFPTAARSVHIAGQFGLEKDGTTPPNFSAQAEIVWSNISEILHDADMECSDIVKVNTYLVDVSDLAESSKVRIKYLGEHAPAATTVIVAGLLRPEWLIEVEVIAAKGE